MDGAQCGSSTAFNLIRQESRSLDDSSFKLSDTPEDFILVYLDENLHNPDLQLDTLENLKSIITCVKAFDNAIECLSYIKCIKDEQIFFVVSGKFREFLTQSLDTLPQLAWIYVFCLNIPENEEWSKKYSKIRGVYADRSSLLTKLDRDVKQSDINLPSIATFSTSNSDAETSIEDLNTCNGRFIFYQLLPEVMLRTPSVENAKGDFLELARFYYKDNKTQLGIIDTFEQTYEPVEAINWYTKDSFVYRIINKTIRLANFDNLWKCRFFIADLHQQLQAKQFNEGRSEPITVYRGQMISKDEFNYISNHIQSYIMFKTFISTTAAREVAEMFAGYGEGRRYGKESVVFEMEIDRKYTANPLSAVGASTTFLYEKETLLSMGNAFRIESVKISDNSVWTIRLKIADFLPVYLRKQMGESDTLLQFKKFILEPGFYFIDGDSSNVEQLFSTPDLKSFDMACFHVTIGHFQLNFAQKLLYYHKAINSLQQDHPLVPLMLNSIAAVYYCKAQYDDALICYKYAMETNKGLLLSNDKLIQIIENLQKPPDQFSKNYELCSAALNHLSSGEEIAIDTTGHGNSCNKFGIPRFRKFHLGLRLEEQQIAYARITDSSSEKEKSFENVCKLYEQIADLYAQEQNYTAAINNLQRLINFRNPPTKPSHPTTIQTTATIPPRTRIPLRDEEMLRAPPNTVERDVLMNDYNIPKLMEEPVKALFDAIEINDESILDRFKKNDLVKLCNVRLLFQSDWSEPHKELQTPFQRACLLGRLKFVQRMLAAGVPANQDVGCTSGSTMRGAFMFACQSQHITVIRLLIAHGADKNSCGSCSTKYAHRTLNIREYNHHNYGWSNVHAIHLALIFNNHEMFNELYSAKHSPNLVTDQYYSTLHLACLFEYPIEMIQKLLDDGANAGLSTDRCNQHIFGMPTTGYYADQLTSNQEIKQLLLCKRYGEMISKYNERRKRAVEDPEKLRDGKSFQIFVKILNGQTIAITTNDDETIEKIKYKIEDRTGTSVYRQRLIWAGKTLCDDQTIGYYGMSKDITLHLVERLVGG